MEESQDIIVATLLGYRYLPIAIECLGSLARHSAERVRLRIHDDGTLTSEAETTLRNALPVHSVVRADEADAMMSAALQDYPACRKFRERFPFGKKLFDLPVLHPGQTVAFADCDVRFLRPFTGLFRFPGPAVHAIFMQDSQNSYALRPWHMVGRRAVHLPRRLNGGLFYYRKTAFDLNLLEDLIGRDYHVYSKSFWLEQTCFGTLAMATQSVFWSATQIRVPTAAADLPDGLVAAHLTSSVRGLISEARKHDRTGPAVSIMTEPMRRLSSVAFLFSEAKRALKRRLARVPSGLE